MLLTVYYVVTYRQDASVQISDTYRHLLVNLFGAIQTLMIPLIKTFYHWNVGKLRKSVKKKSRIAFRSQQLINESKNTTLW